MVFQRCRTCGGYIEESETINSHFCSAECSVNYSRCLNCGKYFSKAPGNEINYCSPLCMVTYALTRMDGHSNLAISKREEVVP